MRFSMPRPSTTGLLAAVGAGFAAVLLAIVSRQSTFALVMGFVAPLPLMIAALGFGGVAGAIAGLVGTVFIGVVDFQVGSHAAAKVLPLDAGRLADAGLVMLLFVIYLGLPSWLLGRLAALPVGAAPMRAGQKLRPEERHLAVILAAIAFFAALSVGVLVLYAGGAAAFNSRIIKACEKFFALVAEKRPLPSGTDPAELAHLLAWFVPAVMSMVMVLAYAINLWLAARVSQMSALLTQPWPDIPRYLRAPPPLAILLAVSAGLSFTGGNVGLASRIVTAALLAAFALQGLAVAHQLLRGRWFRSAVLFTVYFSILVLNGWPLVAWGIVGLLDTAFSFRDRQKPIVKRTS